MPPLNFADFNSVLLTILGVCASGSVTLIALILLLILAWNYIKLLFEAAERYVLLGVVVYNLRQSLSRLPPHRFPLPQIRSWTGKGTVWQ